MVEYTTVNTKLSNSQLNKLKDAVKSRQGTILRINARRLSKKLGSGTTTLVISNEEMNHIIKIVQA